jgi:hypothetical protein
MATADVSVYKIKQAFKIRNIDIYLVILMALQAYALIHAKTIFESTMWYITFILTAILWSLVLAWLRNRKTFFFNLTNYSVYDVFVPALIWGIMLFFVLFFTFKVAGTTFVWGSLEVAIHQMMVASAETLIFCIFLVEALPETWGTVPFTKIRIPNWFWGAGFFFGTYHFSAFYTGDLYQMAGRVLIAVFIGILWFKLFKYGETNKYLGGTGAVISFHWVWNYMAIGVVSMIFPQLMDIVFPL